jgi:hypothetical protein
VGGISLPTVPCHVKPDTRHDLLANQAGFDVKNTLFSFDEFRVSNDTNGIKFNDEIKQEIN